MSHDRSKQSEKSAIYCPSKALWLAFVTIHFGVCFVQLMDAAGFRGGPCQAGTAMIPKTRNEHQGCARGAAAGPLQ
jgi:hypothetical protein